MDFTARGCAGWLAFSQGSTSSAGACRDWTEHWPCLAQILKVLLKTKLELSVHRPLPKFSGVSESAQAARSNWNQHSCKHVQACPQVASSAVGLGVSNTRLSRSIPKISPSKVLPAWTQLSSSPVPEFTSAPSRWCRLSSQKQLCQHDPHSQRSNRKQIFVDVCRLVGRIFLEVSFIQKIWNLYNFPCFNI